MVGPELFIFMEFWQAFLGELLHMDSAYCKYSPWVLTDKRLESTFKDKGHTVTLVQS